MAAYYVPDLYRSPGLCYTLMHAIPSDLLLNVDDAQLLPARYFGVDLLFSSFGPCPSG